MEALIPTIKQERQPKNDPRKTSGKIPRKSSRNFKGRLPGRPPRKTLRNFFWETPGRPQKDPRKTSGTNLHKRFPLFNHIDVLLKSVSLKQTHFCIGYHKIKCMKETLHKVCPGFIILSFYDFPCRDSLYHLCLTFQKALGITAQSKTGEKAKHGKL